MSDKTPLQAVISVICDALCDLPVDDQKRAIEAVCITLGTVPLPAPPVPVPAGSETTVSALLADLFFSLRADQVSGIAQTLDSAQLIIVNALANRVVPPPTTSPDLAAMQGTAAT